MPSPKDEMVLAFGMGKPPKAEGKDMGDDEHDEDMPVEEGEGAFGEFADAAMEALKSGDKAAFSEALRGAIESCSSGEY